MVVYFASLLEKRRTDPQDDMISALVHGKLRGTDEVSPAMIVGFGFTMVTGGNDTVTGALGGSLELLTQCPDQRARLVEDPTRLKTAVEEFLRLTSPVQGLARTATRDVEIEGRTIPQGRKVLLLYASANRDEREFGADAEACDVTRKIRRHVTFSYGPHHCIGAAMARLQLTVAIEELLRRCPEFAVDAAAGVYAPGPFVRRYVSLPFVAQGVLMAGWHREDRPDLAAGRILDAAEKAFIERGVSAAGMAEIAEAAGCSRGTLYRYFPNRHALHVGYVERAARVIQERVRAHVADFADPEARLVESILCAVREVRRNPGTAAWFAPSASGLGARMSQAPEVVETLVTSIATQPLSLPRLPDEASRLRARWIIRIIVSLLSSPGESEAEERALLERFVAPTLTGSEGGEDR